MNDDAPDPPAVGAAAARAWLLSDAGRANKAADEARSLFDYVDCIEMIGRPYIKDENKRNWRTFVLNDPRPKYEREAEQTAAAAARLAATNPRPAATPPADAQPHAPPCEHDPFVCVCVQTGVK